MTLLTASPVSFRGWMWCAWDNRPFCTVSVQLQHNGRLFCAPSSATFSSNQQLPCNLKKAQDTMANEKAPSQEKYSLFARKENPGKVEAASLKAPLSDLLYPFLLFPPNLIFSPALLLCWVRFVCESWRATGLGRNQGHIALEKRAPRKFRSSVV